jgi:type 1 glutamine amidotransferase
MKSAQRIMLCLLVLCIATGITTNRLFGKKKKLPKKVLVFSLTKGYHHASIANGNQFFIALGQQYNFGVDTTTDVTKFNKDTLAKYSAVVWLNTTGDVLNATQQAGFEQYIRSGGGYVGIHAATDTEFDWPWYNSLAGAYFNGHPGPKNVQDGKMITLDKNFPASAHFPDSFQHKDEFYDFKSLKQDSLHFLVRVDEKSYVQGKMGEFHPLAWYHVFDGGRAFYSAFGHTAESFSSPLIMEHFRKGLQWAMGDLR